MKLFSAKYLITMTGETIVDGAVAIEDDEIIDVGKEEDLLLRYSRFEHEDFPDFAIMPGLINCHAHLDMSRYTGFPGDPVRNKAVAPLNFIDWLMGCILYKKNSVHTEQHKAVEAALEECIQSGTTCIADMSTYEGVFHLLDQKHLRAVVFPEVLSITSDVTKNLFESAMAVIEKYAECDSDLVHVGARPHSPYTLSRNLLKIIAQFCHSSKIPLMIHAAESFSEMEFFHNSSGDIATTLFPNIGWDENPPEHQRTPIEHLKQIGFLEAAPLLVGCTQITPRDLDYVAQTGSKIIITPRSHMNLQQGKAPFRDIYQKKILCALGTDGLPSVETLSLWDEMRALVTQHGDALHLSGYDVLSLVTRHAAQALGLSHETGTLEKGKKADMIFLDVSAIPEDGDFLMNLIQNVTNYHIKNVFVGGKSLKVMN